MRQVAMDAKKRIENISRTQWEILAVFLLFAVYVWLQNSHVWMYFDDFGNASLSYGYDSSEISGTQYTIRDLLDWAKTSYLNWGGRVLYALILIPLLKHGSRMFMAFQTVVVLAEFLVMDRLVKRYCGKSGRLITMVCFVLCYGTLSGDIVKHGVYWASASVLYLWPLLPLMMTILVYGNIEGRIRESLPVRFWDCAFLFVAVPFVTLSQEQIGGTLLVWLICNMIFNHQKDERRFLKYDLAILIYAIITYGLFLASPGNWVRLSEDADFASLSLVGKVIRNLPGVLQLTANSGMKYVSLFLLAAGFMMLFFSRTLKEWMKIVLGCCMLPYLYAVGLDVTLLGSMANVPKEICCCIFLIAIFVTSLFYFSERNSLSVVSLLVAAAASIICLVFSPYLALRSWIPYVFFCMIFIAVVFENSYRECEIVVLRKLFVIAMFGISALGIKNMARIYNGYMKNDYVNSVNDTILSNYSGDSDTIYLLAYEADGMEYRSTMPCDEGFEYIGTWMKEYYDIPEEVSLVWKSIEELTEEAEDREISVEYSDGFYEDESGYRWADQESQILLYNNSPDKVKVQITCKISTGYEEISNLDVIVNGKTVETLEVNNSSSEYTVSFKLKPGQNYIQFVSDAEQVVSENQDERDLFVRFSDIVCIELRN